jgi:Mg2+-importing ATPase
MELKSSGVSSARSAAPGHAGLPDHEAFWSLPADRLLADFATTKTGLSAPDAAARLKAAGANVIREEARLGPALLLLSQFKSPLVLILLFGAVISMAMRNWGEAWIIVAIVIGSAALGFVQEYRAARTVDQLKRRLGLTCRVLRDGRETVVAASQVVPGDLVILSAGALVPADGVVLEAEDFLVNEASLTGESYPVEKTPGVVPADAPIGKRTNAAFLGSSVQSGTATMLVARTGQHTIFGSVAARLQARMPETEFARGVRKFGYMLVQVMVAIVLFVLTVNQLAGRPVAESLLFAVALAVGLSPELLPAIIGVTLSAGARLLAARGVIVRRLEVIENLGAMDVLCTDKTGTLTEGVIKLDGATDVDGRPSERVLRLAYCNAALETGIDNPLDAAIADYGRTAGLTADGLKKIDEIPYDFRRKCLTIALEDPDDRTRHLMVIKGTFAAVLSRCSAVAEGGGAVEITDAKRERLQGFYEAKSKEGFRLLAVASRRFAPRPRYEHADESALTFEGFLLFLDPPKPDAGAVVAGLAALGVTVKVISGDNRFVAAHLADSIGIDSRSILTGEQLSHINDEALWQLAPRTTLFVEVDPQQKERIVRALQRTGYTVGYMGDGINDAPALHAADVGISVEGAADVARQSADIVLLKRDLGVLRDGIEGGRRTFANTIKYINITTSANFGNMISMAIVTPLLTFLPLLPMQILLNNFLSDLPAAAISTDDVDRESVVQPRKWDIRTIQLFMIVFGLTSSIFDFITFGLLLLVLDVDQPTFRTAWFLVSLLTELAVVLVLRTRGPVLASKPGRILLLVTLALAAGSLFIPYLGAVSARLGFVPLSPELLALSVLIVAGYVIVTEAVKRAFYSRAVQARLTRARKSRRFLWYW